MNKFFVSAFAYIKKQLQSYLNEEFKNYNLKSSEIFFMQILHTKGQLSQIEISKILECDKSHIHRIVSKLIDKNYIKYACDDKQHPKNLKLMLTKNGEDLSLKFEQVVNKWDMYVKKDIPDEELKIAKKVVLKIFEIACNFKKTECKNA